MLNLQDAHQDWYTIRLHRFRRMLQNILFVVLIMGTLTALERNTLCMVTPGRFGCAAKSPEQAKQDYGLLYHVAYAIAYVFDCIFMSIWIPFFDWWVKELPVSKSVLDSMNMVLLALNQVMCAAHVIYQAAQFVAMLYIVLRFKKASLQADVLYTSWKERSFLVASVLATVGLGSGALHTLELAELARVKTLEYGLVVVPAQILVGLRLASMVQRKKEQRALAGMAASRHVEMGVQDEKVGA
ncbi:hypothetical protein GJ744_002807 [Endocarpon pusillum]|uniref:Uncharacterized protein n=1 Tax=Endocarpon pusillum TaxID=364733 RepID=A0A8H7E6C1_9EURO|nr:hypothetical protein GJ744_002807 [Endocarpon pusillum]